jgi:quercetin dioxygenase-like cupin family protein
MANPTKSGMQAFDVHDLVETSHTASDPFLEFLRVPAMSLGLYTLPAGSTDPQHPHGEDEVYYVVAGQATIRVAGEDRPVAPGSIVFIPTGVEHRFHSITDTLRVLVFFAPAEGSAAE